MKTIIRTNYLNTINQLLDKNVVLLLVGVRRVGKSTILKQFLEQDYVKNTKYAYIALEQFQYLGIRKKDDLITLLQQQSLDKLQYLIIDEIQLVEDREEVINGVYSAYPSLIILLTGSNSNLLSSEIATNFRGRSYQIYVYPFDISEYTLFHNIAMNRFGMEQYLKDTGLPMVQYFPDPAYIIQELINVVFLKDIVERYAIKDIDLLRSIFGFIISNIGNITNLAKIAEHLQHIGYVINLNTIGNYIEYLKNSLLVYECPLYDIQGKKIFDKLRKFYIADHGLRNYLLLRFDLGTGKQLENYIYLQLLKHHYQVYTGRIGHKEIDFVAEKNGKKMYIQVTWSLDSSEVYDREFGSLLGIKDNWNKYVISMDTHMIESIENIKHLQAWNYEELFTH